MKEFRSKKPDEFRKYAEVDSVLSLYHALVVEESALTVTHALGIPVTISSMSRRIMESRLVRPAYKLPTKNSKYSERNISKLYTPKGVNLAGDLSSYLYLLLGSYRGGRGECYMYGVVPGPIYDYDLSGAYPTAMSMLSYPDIDKIEMYQKITYSKFKSYNYDLLRCYSAFKIYFKFSPSVRYPNLPVMLDDTTTVFPLEGITICTGLELVLADRLGCEIDIQESVIIPFQSKKVNKNNTECHDMSGQDVRYVFERSPEIKELLSFLDNEVTKLISSINKSLLIQLPIKEISIDPNMKKDFENVNIKRVKEKETRQTQTQTQTQAQTQTQTQAHTETENEEENEELKTLSQNPFFNLVKELVEKRSRYEKGSYHNAFYKLIANSGIGQMGRGLGGKTNLDINGYPIPIPTSELSSPLYAS